MKKLYISFKTKISLSMLVIFIPLLFILSIINYIYIYKQFNNKKIQVESEIVNSLVLINESYKILDRAVQDQIKDAFKMLNKKYAESGNKPNKIDLSAIKKELDDDMDIYIIENGVIKYTTFSKDLGLDFKSWPTFFISLEKLRKSGGYRSDLMNFENLSGQLRKYSYQSSPDKKYIFELAFTADKFQKYMEILNPTRVSKLISNRIPMVDSVSIYNNNGRSLYNSNTKLTENTKKIIGKIIKDKKEYEIMGIFKSTRFIYVNLSGNDFEQANRIVEIHYNHNEFLFLILTQVVIVIVGIIICILFVTKRANKISEPLYLLRDSVNKIIVNDNFKIKTGIRTNDEFGDLSGSFDILLEVLNENYISIVKVLANAIEAADEYTRGHCDRVEGLSSIIASKLYLKRQQRENLRVACILHDIGKIGIHAEILNKPSKLSQLEFELIKQHPTIGYKMIKDVKFLSDSAKILLQHHERVDGKGYPKGLRDGEIRIEAKILCIADAIDAMTSARVYRGTPLTKEELINELNKNKNKQFDNEITDLVLKLLNSDGHFSKLLFDIQ